MVPFEKEVFGVILDEQATGAFGVAPGEIDAANWEPDQSWVIS